MAPIVSPSMGPAPMYQAPYAQDVRVVDDGGGAGLGDEQDYQQALQYSVSGSEALEDLGAALEANGIAEDLDATRIFDAAPEPCDTGCPG